MLCWVYYCISNKHSARQLNEYEVNVSLIQGILLLCVEAVETMVGKLETMTWSDILKTKMNGLLGEFLVSCLVFFSTVVVEPNKLYAESIQV